jgi:hypothetical protein
MGADDSQKLLPWSGTYSPLGRSKPPAHGKSNFSSKAFCSGVFQHQV